MGKSASGPDILDCGPMMEAIGKLHGVDESLTILPGGGRWPTGVEVLALAVRRPIARPAASYAVSRSEPYPNKDSAPLEWRLCKLQHQRDRACTGMREPASVQE